MDELFGNKDIKESLNQLIKIGEVSSVDPARGTARVTFDDDDSLVSYDLQVLQRNTYDNKDYAMPDVNEDVVCLFLPCGSEDGFILGSVYSGEITPPESDGDVRTVVFSDGTKISYNRKSHTLSAEIGKTSIVADQQNVNVNTDGTATVKASTINLTGNVSITGNVNITGGITATADIIAMGKTSLSAHTHTDSLNKPTSVPV